jgi:hypothetical protein
MPPVTQEDGGKRSHAQQESSFCPSGAASSNVSTVVVMPSKAARRSGRVCWRRLMGVDEGLRHQQLVQWWQQLLWWQQQRRQRRGSGSSSGSSDSICRATWLLRASLFYTYCTLRHQLLVPPHRCKVAGKIDNMVVEEPWG